MLDVPEYGPFSASILALPNPKKSKQREPINFLKNLAIRIEQLKDISNEQKSIYLVTACIFVMRAYKDQSRCAFYIKIDDSLGKPKPLEVDHDKQQEFKALLISLKTLAIERGFSALPPVMAKIDAQIEEIDALAANSSAAKDSYDTITSKLDAAPPTLEVQAAPQAAAEETNPTAPTTSDDRRLENVFSRLFGSMNDSAPRHAFVFEFKDTEAKPNPYANIFKNS